MAYFTYFVERKDTLLNLCYRHRLKVKEFVDLNNIYPLRELILGEEVKIPYRHPYKYFHNVKEGETLDYIAQRYHTTVQSISFLNMVDNLKIDQHLLIPEVRVRLAQPHIMREEHEDTYFYSQISYLIDDIVKVALREQLKLLSQHFKQNINLRTYILDDDLGVVDLANLFIVNGLGAEEEMMIYHTIIDVLSAYKEIKYVQFLSEGALIEESNGHVDLSQPFEVRENMQHEI